MRKYIYICSLFFTLALQPAYAQKYEYTGHTPPTYININGEQYVRIPHKRQAKKYSHYTLSPLTKIKPYIGLNIGYNKLDRITPEDEHITELSYVSYAKLPQKNISLSGILGLQLNHNFSLEAYYQSTIANDKKNGTTTITIPLVDATYNTSTSTQLSFKSYGIDFIYNTPIFSQNIELLLTLGLGSYNINSKYVLNPHGDNIFSSSNKSIGYRFGFGGQYNFNEHISLTTILRYIKLTDDKIINNIFELSTGIKYSF